MPTCDHCSEDAFVSKRGLPWWSCANDECDVVAFIDDAPATEDPRDPQQTLGGASA